MKVGEDIFQFEAACFGISTLPQLWMEVMKVFSKDLEKKGHHLFHLLGRHFGHQYNPQGSGERSPFYAPKPRGCGDGNKLPQKCAKANTNFTTLGFHGKFGPGCFGSSQTKVENGPKGVRKTPNPPTNFLPQNGGHFGEHQKFSDGNALFKGLYRSNAQVCKPKSSPRVGQKVGHPKQFARRGEGAQCSHIKLERPPVFGKSAGPTTSFGQFRFGLGGDRCRPWNGGSGIMAGKGSKVWRSQTEQSIFPWTIQSHFLT